VSISLGDSATKVFLFATRLNTLINAQDHGYSCAHILNWLIDLSRSPRPRLLSQRHRSIDPCISDAGQVFITLDNKCCILRGSLGSFLKTVQVSRTQMKPIKIGTRESEVGWGFILQVSVEVLRVPGLGFRGGDPPLRQWSFLQRRPRATDERRWLFHPVGFARAHGLPGTNPADCPPNIPLYGVHQGSNPMLPYWTVTKK